MRRFHTELPVLSVSAIAVVLILVLACASIAAESGDLAERLRRRLEASAESNALVVDGQQLFCTESLRRFYQRHGYASAWTHDRRPTAQVDSLLSVVLAAECEGLDRFDYHFKPLSTLLNKSDSNRTLSDAALADLDLLLTDAFLLLGAHFYAGHLDPESIDPEWTANRRSGDLSTILQEALANQRVGAALRELLPPQPGYARLRTLLQELRKLRDQGGWPIVPAGAKLQLGDTGPRVLALDSRLRSSADRYAAAEFFNGALADRVRRFQQHHGLEIDGVVGPATLAALNVSVEDRIAQVMVNLERWRWLPQDLGRQHLLMNIADQRLQAFVDGQPVFESAVIVGRVQRRTPVFSGRIAYLVFGPFWEVPPSLAVQDKLPELRRDLQRLIDLGFQVLRGWGQAEEEIDPRTVDWNAVTAASFSYRLRQKPGPQNALGSVKFMFPNKHNVYLHDTPSRDLFGKSSRAFSSGCIRVQRPAELARVLLADQPVWTSEAIEIAMTTAQDRTVYIKASWMVHLEYWTAWVEPDGTAQFRDDIYGRDARVLSSLKEAPNTSP